MMPVLTGPDRTVLRALGRALLVGSAALTVANCTSQTMLTGGRHPSEAKYGVVSSPRVIPEGQPVPKGGGREMTGQPYVVAGRTYVPQDGKGYSKEGWASWYGSAFHGRLTANGEIFDRQSVLAAHPTLPLPSYVRVTNLVNGRSMVVRVNDRGPYEAGRLIDLSERAAEALDFRRRGTTRVAVRYLGRAPLAGSDDGKLLATLQTHAKETPRTLLAALGLAKPEAEDRKVAPPAPVRLASLSRGPAALPQRGAGPSVRREPAVAAVEPPKRTRTADALPPSRPRLTPPTRPALDDDE